MYARQTAAAQCEVISMVEMFVCVWRPTRTIHSLSGPHIGLSHWWAQLQVVRRRERERWGGGERGNRGGEERGRLVEKQSELTAVYTYTYVTAVLEISEALMRAHMDVNFYTPNLYFQLFTLQSHFTRSHTPKHTQVIFCLPKVMVWPSDVNDACICWNLVFKVLKFLFYNNWDYVSCIQ